MIDIDGLQTNEELTAFISHFDRSREELRPATPGTLRAANEFRGARRWLQQPSDVFIALLEHDTTAGTSSCHDYTEAACELMRHVASLDAHVSHVEIAAIDDVRKMLKASAHSAGVRSGSTAGGSSLCELLEELDALIGLDEVKRRIRVIADVLNVRALRAEHGLMNPPLTNHLVFVGNPGTGKTTVARLYGQILHALGALRSGHLVEVDRADLVAGYVGQTAARVDAIVDSALGGVLLIDEAYGLTRGDDAYGSEAIDAIVKRMEDHRGDLVIIATGYPTEMDSFLDTNPGLRSRFAGQVTFDDYATTELVQIFLRISKASGYDVDPQADGSLAAAIDALPRGRGFGNGRAARQLFEDAIARHATRVSQLESPTRHDLMMLTVADFERESSIRTNAALADR